MSPSRAALFAAVALVSAAPSLAAQHNEVTRAVANGGISAPGWAGAVDAQEAKAGMTLANQRLAAFQVPKRIVILDEIPKGATGKLQRIGLAQKLGLA